MTPNTLVVAVRPREVVVAAARLYIRTEFAEVLRIIHDEINNTIAGIFFDLNAIVNAALAIDRRCVSNQ